MLTANGYIEGTELDGFLREFVSSANVTDVDPEAVSDAMLAELKSCFMEAYDDNQDGKIDIREVCVTFRTYDNNKFCQRIKKNVIYCKIVFHNLSVYV